jgi:hypothetical protein
MVGVSPGSKNPDGSAQHPLRGSVARLIQRTLLPWVAMQEVWMVGLSKWVVPHPSQVRWWAWFATGGSLLPHAEQ